MLQLVNACTQSPICDDSYVNCIIGCAIIPDDGGDAGLAACFSDCDSQFPEGKLKYEAAVGCADTKCATECG